MAHTNVLESQSAILVVVDVQEKMLDAVCTAHPRIIIQRIDRLIAAADILKIPVLFTEQYPKGLGLTDPVLTKRLKEAGATGPLVKSTCSCWRDEAFRNAVQRSEREHVILVGLETHVCIQQTALDLLRVDYAVFVPVDAVGSRSAIDMNTALERMRSSGVEISTSESLIFELIERCDHPNFKEILNLVK
jgi:nicotinamidase-related amidase